VHVCFLWLSLVLTAPTHGGTTRLFTHYRELHGDKYFSPSPIVPTPVNPSPSHPHYYFQHCPIHFLLINTWMDGWINGWIPAPSPFYSHPQPSPHMIFPIPVLKTIITYQIKLKNGKVKIHQHNKPFIRQLLISSRSG